MREQDERNRITIGLDLGDRRHRFCVLDGKGEVVEEGTLSNKLESLSELSRRYRRALVVMEAGCHSPWISRHLEGAGCEVVVSNPRKTRAIYQHERKSDRRDALMLARIARMEPALLYPVQHGSAQAQHDLLRIKLRDSLVRARVGVINSLRFTLKSLGYAIANPSTERFHKVIQEQVPESVDSVIAPSVQALKELSLRIKLLDREIASLARSKYPETTWLEQIPGVGPITALYFVLKIQDPARFERVRDVGAFIGLCPRRDQSGENDPQLRISKRGDAYLRRLLVSAAQYILGPFGPPSALRQYGLALASGGTPRAKKRAVVAIARKLAVLLLTLWKNKSVYQAFPLSRDGEKMRTSDPERLRCIA